MCEIQFIRNFEKDLTEGDKKEFLKLMKLGSFFNNDAFGYLNSKIRFRQGGNYNESKIKIENLNDNFIVGHNRKATNIFRYIEDPNNKVKLNEININNHPFNKNEFLLVHNGVIRNHNSLRHKYDIKTNVVTDSYVILFLIDYFFKLSKELSRDKKIIDAIKKTTNDLRGEYSVFFYDKKTNNLFYFKDCIKTFYFCNVIKDNGDKILCGSTIKSNLKKIYLKCNKEYFQAEDEAIYIINNNIKKNILKKVGFIEEKSKIIGLMEEISVESNESELYKTLRGLFGFVPNCFVGEDNFLTICLKDKSTRDLIITKLTEYLLEYVEANENILININELYN